MPETHLVENMQTAIREIRGQRVMMDSDLAGFYGVATKVLNQAVRRNIHRFPADFAFALTAEEFADLRSQIVTSSGRHGGRRTLPWVFTEHGAVMLASVLNSAQAISASVQIVRAFVKMHRALMAPDLVAKLVEIESRLSDHDDDISTILNIVRQLATPEEPQKEHREIGFHSLREEPANYKISRRTRKEKM